MQLTMSPDFGIVGQKTSDFSLDHVSGGDRILQQIT